jgi:polyisoprenoid-binding protein YceI
MKSAARWQSLVPVVAMLSLPLAPASLSAAGHGAPLVEIDGGTAVFDAATNVSAISVHGKSTSLKGRARIRENADGLVIEELEAVLPVKTLATGMGLRDEHMRKYVFMTSDGLLPDLRFVAERVVCSGPGGTRTCQVLGILSIRDTPRPFTMALKVKPAGRSFRAAGDGVVKLSAYGIPPPSQLGVRAMDDVKLHLDFLVVRVEERNARGIR